MEIRIPKERAETDRVLQAERVESDDALKEADRATTDRLLMMERASADRSLALRDEMLRLASHDLRGMIGIIGLNADLIDDRLGGRDRAVQACLCDINTLAGRMTRLVEDLTDSVRMETGELTVVRTTHDALGLLREVHAIFGPVALAHGVGLDRESPSCELLCSFDDHRISQVLSNLVGNAIKFTPAHGHISLAACCADGELVFSVADEGCGIAADMLERVFERSFQVPGGLGVGSGLGLYICRGIVEAHGGRIWAESTLGEGSTFRFTLPSAASERSAAFQDSQAHVGA